MIEICLDLNKDLVDRLGHRGTRPIPARPPVARMSNARWIFTERGRKWD